MAGIWAPQIGSLTALDGLTVLLVEEKGTALPRSRGTEHPSVWDWPSALANSEDWASLLTILQEL